MFGLAAAATAGVGHGAIGEVWSRVFGHRSARGLAVGLSLAAVGLDIGWWRSGRPVPFAVKRQVPRPWGHARGGAVVAVRYGARMGIGPATILNTWLWWATLLIGATAGPWRSALVGVVFATSRAVTNAVVARRVADGLAMHRRMERIVHLEGPVRLASGAAAIMAVVTLAVH